MNSSIVVRRFFGVGSYNIYIYIYIRMVCLNLPHDDVPFAVSSTHSTVFYNQTKHGGVGMVRALTLLSCIQEQSLLGISYYAELREPGIHSILCNIAIPWRPSSIRTQATKGISNRPCWLEIHQNISQNKWRTYSRGNSCQEENKLHTLEYNTL